MTAAQRQEITRHLAAFDFSGLFTDSALGWNWPASSSARVRVPFGGSFLDLAVVAEKCGVKVLQCPPDAKGRIPLSEDRRRIEKAVAPLASEHLILFTDAAKTRQVWQWPAKRPGKPSSLRELTWEQGKANELLLQKLTSIAFTLDEEEGLDITGVVRRLTDTLDRDKVTKRFYDLFKKQKDAFQKFIKGLSDTGLQAWYTSLMLNRIMFCYFLQRKGFLDGDQNYLANRLARVQDQIGKNQFHSFYRSFLRRLFHEGLGSQERSQELIALIGTIPYLNGGIFDEHPIERGHPNLSIPDEAFEKVFKFFDQFDWHLDDRPIAGGNEINPEILGYVFEKYTNQKEMGAYYTKEDITEYISKNCIIPFLINAVADKVPASTWQMLANDPDRYIYPAVRHGAGSSLEEWEASLPKNIRRGLRPATLNKPVTADRPIKTLELRKDWNTTTPAPFNLATEIWRETIARHQRCHELREKLRSGSVTSIDEFITLNLDIRQFAQDVIESADAALLLAFFKRLKTLSVLDPTCGSGAFLFAALEILEPLYTACIQRFRALLADWQSSGEKHPNWEKEIKAILDHAAAHPNEGYYIHKTIIVHNLYGVDIMEEAVEICKLRLFLKLAAQLEPGQEVEPLPDIDFNIRSGNTLVGYASRDEVRRAFTEHQGGGKDSQLLLGGIEHSLDDYRRIEEQAQDADMAFKQFHAQQENTKLDAASFRSAKQNLQRTLEVMRDELDRFLASDYDKKHLKTETAFTKWRQSHQPFHWFIEFYGIMNQGGFDVIIGNPPYIVYSEAKVPYTLLDGCYSTLGCKNLYGITLERAVKLGSHRTLIGLIVQLTLISSGKMAVVQDLLLDKFSLIVAPFPRRPESLFDGVEMPVVIAIAMPAADTRSMWTSNIGRFYTAERPGAMANIIFTNHNHRLHDARIGKLSTGLESSIVGKLRQQKQPLDMMTREPSEHRLYYQEACRYWLKASHKVPKFRRNGESILPPHGRDIGFTSKEAVAAACCILNSSCFYWFYSAFSDCEHVNDQLVRDWRLPYTHGQSFSWIALADRLIRDLEKNALPKTIQTKQGHKIEYAEINASNSKPIIDQIDTVLAQHYGFTEEELDFILNYDIKYRLGLGREGSAEGDASED